MNIGIGRSTIAFMIADPLAVLEEGEVHMGFSTIFRDSKSGFSDTMLHNIDVLVARSPAHLPSDIQKVIPLERCTPPFLFQEELSPNMVLKFWANRCIGMAADKFQVRAVFKPELRIYKDVIVFSSRGSIPLAEKLSG